MDDIEDRMDKQNYYYNKGYMAGFIEGTRQGSEFVVKFIQNNVQTSIPRYIDTDEKIEKIIKQIKGEN